MLRLGLVVLFAIVFMEVVKSQGDQMGDMMAQDGSVSEARPGRVNSRRPVRPRRPLQERRKNRNKLPRRERPTRRPKNRELRRKIRRNY
ncbi:hypothetical protein D918_05502 [Trichuris suis]